MGATNPASAADEPNRNPHHGRARALNREIDAIRGSGPGGMGMGPMGMPGAGMMNRAPQTTERTGDVQRVVVTLFAETSAEKMAWFAILQPQAGARGRMRGTRRVSR